MKYLTTLLLLFMFSSNFKNNQIKYERVKEAYALKLEGVKSNLKKHDLDPKNYSLYIRVFKQDEIIELWGKDMSNLKQKLFRTYEVCQSSGKLGPKRKKGDYQVPEGFYHIDRFNPVSKFHLSLGINYPNTSDKILGVQNNLGGDIFIHGDCVTIGCIPITDNEIKSFYVYCVEAINNGQKTIPVTFFPAKLDTNNYNLLISKTNSSQTLQLWKELKLGYDLFNKNKTLPNIAFLDDGKHIITE